MAPATRGQRRHLVDVIGPTATAPDSDGGWTQTLGPLDPPTWYVSIVPASAADLERMTAGAAVTRASHIVVGDHHPGISTATQLRFTDYDGRPRTFYVSGVLHPEERGRETVAFCEEHVPA